MSKYIYKSFEYDGRVITSEKMKERLLAQGWQELESSDEMKKHAWPLTIGTKLNTHRDKHIETVVMKRQAELTQKPAEETEGQ